MPALSKKRASGTATIGAPNGEGGGCVNEPVGRYRDTTRQDSDQGGSHPPDRAAAPRVFQDLHSRYRSAQSGRDQEREEQNHASSVPGRGRVDGIRCGVRVRAQYTSTFRLRLNHSVAHSMSAAPVEIRAQPCEAGYGGMLVAP